MRHLAYRLRAIVGVAVAQLRGQPVRTLLVVVGVALAVLAATLLAGVGMGVLETGEEKFSQAGRDLWLTGGPLAISPEGPSTLENTIHDSHAVASEIRSREAVATAAPIGFETVFVGTNESNIRLITGVGVLNTHGENTIKAGRDLQENTSHYANGTYEGPMTRNVLVDPRTAEMFDLEPGDTLLVGGSRSAAREQEFTVVGITPDYGQLLGTPTVTLHLSELQTLTGAAGTDRASLIAVRLAEGYDPRSVESALASEYPDHEVRTNREQLVAVVGQNVVVLATAAVLVVLAMIAGIALTANLLALSVTSRRRTLAALQAVGLSRRTLLLIVAIQGLLLGFLGWSIAAVLTPPAAAGLDQVAAAVVGFENLLRVPRWLYAAGAGIGLAVGAGGAVVAGLLVTRLEPLRQLQE